MRHRIEPPDRHLGAVGSREDGELGVDRSSCAGPSYVIDHERVHERPGPCWRLAEGRLQGMGAVHPDDGDCVVVGERQCLGHGRRYDWSETWNESGSVALKLKRDPVNLADYLFADNGSSYSIIVLEEPDGAHTDNHARSPMRERQSGSGTPTGPRVPREHQSESSTHLMWPTRSPTCSAFLGLPLSYSETIGGTCGNGSSGPTAGSGPFYHGIAQAPGVPAQPQLGGRRHLCERLAVRGRMGRGQSTVRFQLHRLATSDGGSQTITVSGTVAYDNP